jgi:hypothetical protein
MAAPQRGQSPARSYDSVYARRSVAVNLLRAINTAEYPYKSKHGAFASWDALVTSEEFNSQGMPFATQNEAQLANAAKTGNWHPHVAGRRAARNSSACCPTGHDLGPCGSHHRGGCVSCAHAATGGVTVWCARHRSIDFCGRGRGTRALRTSSLLPSRAPRHAGGPDRCPSRRVAKLVSCVA